MAQRRARRAKSVPPQPVVVDPVLVYELHGPGSAALPEGSLAVTITVRRRDGQACPFVPFVQRPGAHVVNRLTDEPDLKVAALLPGGRLAEWTPHVAENFEGRYTLGPALVERALPWILRSRRARVDEGPRLVWLGDAPWQLVARLERDEDAGAAALRFELVRGEERLDFGDPTPWRIGEYVLVGALGLRLVSPTAARFVEELLARGDLQAPIAREHELAARLRDAPPGLAIRADAAPIAAPRAVLELSTRESERALGVRLVFDYGGERVRARDQHDLVHTSDRESGTARRDRKMERALLDAAAPLREGTPRPLVTFEEEDRGVASPRALQSLVAAASAVGWNVEAEHRPVRAATRSVCSIRSGVDWFTLEGDVKYDEARVRALRGPRRRRARRQPMGGAG
jgi:hypothetical protein